MVVRVVFILYPPLMQYLQMSCVCLTAFKFIGLPICQRICRRLIGCN